MAQILEGDRGIIGAAAWWGMQRPAALGHTDHAAAEELKQETLDTNFGTQVAARGHRQNDPGFNQHGAQVH